MYLILVIQFGSFLDPLAILISLPLSLIGVVLALIVTRDTLNIMSLIGVILLMGIVAKNAILLIDFAKWAHERGTPLREALIEAGRIRLRPDHDDHDRADRGHDSGRARKGRGCRFPGSAGPSRHRRRDHLHALDPAGHPDGVRDPRRLPVLDDGQGVAPGGADPPADRRAGRQELRSRLASQEPSARSNFRAEYLHAIACPHVRSQEVLFLSLLRATPRRVHRWLRLLPPALVWSCAGQTDRGPIIVTFPGSVARRRGGGPAPAARAVHTRSIPDIRVVQRDTPDAADQRHQLYVQWLNAGASDPDILQLDAIWTPEFAAAGWILPLDRFDPDTAAFFPATIRANRWQDPLFALPWFVDVGMLYWRTDLVSAPATSTSWASW